MTTIKNVPGIRVVLCYISLISLLLACTTGVSEGVPDSTPETPVSIPTSTPKSAPTSTPKDDAAIEDYGFLSGEPCGPPCFFGILPGDTAKTDAIEILKNEGLLQQCEEREFVDGSVRILQCPAMVFYFDYKAGTEIVTLVGFWPDGITVGDIIAKDGPDDVLVTCGGTPEHPYTEMWLYYDDVKAQVYLPLQYRTDPIFQVEKTTEVDSIDYYSDVASREHLADRLQEWKGYGEYECF